MSYDTEELRIGIVEMFDDAVGTIAYQAEFGTLHSTANFRDRPITDAELLGEPPRSLPLAEPLEPGINSIAAWKKQLATCLQKGYRVCPQCGARAAVHRCP